MSSMPSTAAAAAGGSRGGVVLAGLLDVVEGDHALQPPPLVHMLGGSIKVCPHKE